MKRALGLLGLVVLFASSTASAQERPEAEVANGERPERTWYGYQTLAADGVAVVMTSLGLESAIHDATSGHRSSSEATTALLVVGGGMTYLFAAPTIHALHGHWGKAGGSLGLRAAPFALCAAILGAGSSSSTNAGREKADAVGGAALFLGIIAAMAIDSSVIANETVAPTPTTALAPTFDPKTKAAGLSFAATF